MYHEIKGIIYRVNFQYGSCFVECDEGNAQEELYLLLCEESGVRQGHFLREPHL